MTTVLKTSLPDGSQKLTVHSPLRGIVKSLWIHRHYLEHYHN